MNNETTDNEQLIIDNSQFTIHNSPPPQPVPKGLERLRRVHGAISAGLVQTCHDCSEGGLAVAVAEMCLAGRLGADIDLAQVAGAADLLADEQILFSESAGRFVVEVRAKDAEAFEVVLKDVPHACIGTVEVRPTLSIKGLAQQTIIKTEVTDLEKAWRGYAGQPGAPAPAVAGINIAAAPTKSPPKVFILHANGTNRDREAALACQLAGAEPEIVHINQLLACERNLLDYHMLVIPGGFSYGDDLGAGVLWALDLRHRLGSDVNKFVESGRPVLGICNGFQALVKAGLLPGLEMNNNSDRPVSLVANHSSHFECRWVYLQPNPHSPSLFTAGLAEPVYCPVAHGEGRLVVANSDVLSTLQANHLDALTYINADGSPAAYPFNPNGSAGNIAGLCNPAGNVLGLMPHPEDHVFPWQHPHRHRGAGGLDGLRLFKNGVKHA